MKRNPLVQFDLPARQTMSVNLTRVDITQLPTCSARGTLKLLPFGGHKRQKIVVGTDQMSVVCLSMKHFECKTVFETSLAQEDNIVTPISSVYIQADTQKIYASAGTSVSGINKKEIMLGLFLSQKTGFLKIFQYSTLHKKMKIRPKNIYSNDLYSIFNSNIPNFFIHLF